MHALSGKSDNEKIDTLTAHVKAATAREAARHAPTHQTHEAPKAGAGVYDAHESIPLTQAPATEAPPRFPRARRPRPSPTRSSPCRS